MKNGQIRIAKNEWGKEKEVKIPINEKLAKYMVNGIWNSIIGSMAERQMREVVALFPSGCGGSSPSATTNFRSLITEYLKILLS